MESYILRKQKSFFIYPTAPFHFDGTFHKPSHFPDKLNDWEQGRYWQAIRIGRRLFGLKIEKKIFFGKEKMKKLPG